MARLITKEENIAYLEKKAYYAGFGIEANKAINENIAKGTPEFKVSLPPMRVADQDMLYRLDFRQSDKIPEIYFFNGFQATMKDDATKTQFFAMSKNHGITARESVNLLMGRAVAKSIEVKNPQNNEMSKEEMWTYIDFKAPKKDNGNFERKTVFPWDFDIHKAMAAIPFNKEMSEWKLAALKKGNLVAHEMIIDGKKLSGTMVVNIPFKTIDVFDDKGVRVLQANGNRLANYEKVLESWDAKKEDHPDIDRSFHEENARKETMPQQQDEGQEKHDVPAVAENVPAHEVPALPEPDKAAAQNAANTPSGTTEGHPVPQEAPEKNRIPERHRRPKKETSATENAPAKGVRR